MVEAPPGPIPRPRRSKVVGRLPKKESCKLEPRPAVAAATVELLSGFTMFISWPTPRSREGLEAAAPICAAFWSNAVADMADCAAV